MEREQRQREKERFKICVAGAAEAGFCGIDAMESAKKLGKEIVRQGGILISGAVSGFPLWAAMGAKEAGGYAIGFSPAKTKDEHKTSYRLQTEYFDHIVYTGFGASGTNLVLTRSSDAVIIGCGRVGVVNEFTVAYEEHKPIGILKGAWKTDEIVQTIIERSNLETDKIVVDVNPTTLVDRVIALITQDKSRQKTFSG